MGREKWESKDGNQIVGKTRKKEEERVTCFRLLVRLWIMIEDKVHTYLARERAPDARSHGPSIGQSMLLAHVNAA